MVKERMISEENILYELMRLESLSFFSKLSNGDKIEYIIARANNKIVEWHFLLSLEGNKNILEFEKWKEMLLQEFCNEEQTKYDVYKMKKKKEQKLSEFIRDVENKGRRLGIIFEDRKRIVLRSIPEEALEIKYYIRMANEFCKETIEIIEEIEKNFYEEKQEEANKKQNRRIDLEHGNKNEQALNNDYKKIKKQKRREAVQVDQVGVDKSLLIKRQEKIVISGKIYGVVLDTGAHYNFISMTICKERDLKLKRLHTPIFFRTCLDEEFYVKNYVDLNFNYEGVVYQERFYILPKVKSLKILIGREFIAKLKPKNLGSDNKLICHIKTEPGKSVQEKTYPVSKAQEDGVSEAINELLKKKYIRISSSTWINNMNPVIKPNNTYRITVNFVKLNKLVELDKYSLPKIEEMIYNLKEMSYFSKIDLKDGFFQVPLAEEDRFKTAFRFKHQLYEWNVMPMGFKNSPAIFQRVMDNALREEIGKCCFVYVDDILVFGRTEKEHDLGLERVLKQLERNKLEINKEKTILKIRETEFVGYNVKENEIRPIIDDKEAIENYCRPKNRHDVQSFVGLVNYYRKFIPNCSSLMEPITRLLSTKIDFKWEDEQEKKFIKVKKILLSEMVLNQPDYTKDFILETDACSYGLGAILSQDFEEGRKPVIFISRKLKTEEVNYSISEKECLAALWAMEKLKYFLYGREFTLVTDHQALMALNNGEIKSQRIERWFERLSHFNYKIVYKKGEEIPHVDALSRSLAYEEEDVLEISNIEEVKDVSDENVEETLENKKKIIREKHIELVHRGKKVVVEELKKEYDWTDLAVLTGKVLNECPECKKFNAKKDSKIKFVDSYERGEKFAMDIIGPIEGCYVIAGIDYFTRKGFAKVISSRTVKNVLKFLDEVYDTLKFKKLIVDQAKEFLSKDLAQWTVKIISNYIILHLFIIKAMEGLRGLTGPYKKAYSNRKRMKITRK